MQRITSLLAVFIISLALSASAADALRGATAILDQLAQGADQTKQPAKPPSEAAKLRTDVSKLIPGHGPLSTVKELKEFHEMLVETSGLVEKAIAAGKTLDEIKATGLPDKWKSWSAPTINTARWLEMLYRGLKPK